MNIIPQALVQVVQQARARMGDVDLYHPGDGANGANSLVRYVLSRSLDGQVSRLMVGPSILSVEANYRRWIGESLAMYVPCLGLSLVNLTDRFFSLGQAWR